MTLGKVTDERAVEEGGREMGLKRAYGGGGGQARSITALKKNKTKKL